MLTCWPPAPDERNVSIRIVGRIDRDVGDRIGFGQHGDGARGRVDPSLRLRLRHALHAVAARFELELRIGACPDDARDHLLVAAELGGRCRHDLDLPAVALGVARVHPEEVAREERRLVAAGAGADLEEDVALVVRVLRQQHLLQVGGERGHLVPRDRPLLVCERAHRRVLRELVGGAPHRARRPCTPESARRPARSPRALSSARDSGRGRVRRRAPRASHRAPRGAARAGRVSCATRVSSVKAGRIDAVIPAEAGIQCRSSVRNDAGSPPARGRRAQANARCRAGGRCARASRPAPRAPRLPPGSAPASARAGTCW